VPKEELEEARKLLQQMRNAPKRSRMGRLYQKLQNTSGINTEHIASAAQVEAVRQLTAKRTRFKDSRRIGTIYLGGGDAMVFNQNDRRYRDIVVYGHSHPVVVVHLETKHDVDKHAKQYLQHLGYKVYHRKNRAGSMVYIPD